LCISRFERHRSFQSLNKQLRASKTKTPCQDEKRGKGQRPRGEKNETTTRRREIEISMVVGIYDSSFFQEWGVESRPSKGTKDWKPRKRGREKKKKDSSLRHRGFLR